MRQGPKKVRLNGFEYAGATQPPWPRPAACALKDGVLHFTWGDTAGERSATLRLETKAPAVPDSRVWERFIGLTSASDERIREFAEAYGPLKRGAASVSEQVADWRRYAVTARAITNVAACIKLERIGEQADWKNLSEFCMHGPPTPPPDTLPEWKALVARALEKFVKQPEQFQVVLRWAGDYPDVVLAPVGLLGLIAEQIMNAISGQARLELCAGCGTEFSPERRATTGVRRYCPECRARKRPQRDAMRDFRAGIPFRKRRMRKAAQESITPGRKPHRAE